MPSRSASWRSRNWRWGDGAMGDSAWGTTGGVGDAPGVVARGPRVPRLARAGKGPPPLGTRCGVLPLSFGIAYSRNIGHAAQGVHGDPERPCQTHGGRQLHALAPL